MKYTSEKAFPVFESSHDFVGMIENQKSICPLKRHFDV